MPRNERNSSLKRSFEDLSAAAVAGDSQAYLSFFRSSGAPRESFRYATTEIVFMAGWSPGLSLRH